MDLMNVEDKVASCYGVQKQDQSPFHTLLCKYKLVHVLQIMSSSAIGQLPQDQSLTQLLLCKTPDDRPVLWLVTFSADF